MSLFPSLAGFEPTRKTLHLYAHAIGVLPRAYATPHDKWWHISLRPDGNGLRSASFELPDGQSAWMRLDLVHHLAIFETSYGGANAVSLAEGRTGTEMGEAMIKIAADHGLEDEVAREKFENDEPRNYDPDQAENFLTAVNIVYRIFQGHRATLPGRKGPIQIWPHGFDMAFEWFGTRVQTHEEHGKVQTSPAQLNLGFYPGGDPYFYSNPWPFEGEQLLGHQLPAGASWHTEGWQGTMLPYSELVGSERAEEHLRSFARRVYEVAAPTLMA